MIRCFYHSADLDGHCSGAIVKYKYPDAVMYPINYGDPFPWTEIEMHPEDEVYMVDFCLQPFSEMARLGRLFNESNVVWIDHHKSTVDEYMGPKYCSPLFFKDIRLDTTKAACELTWEYLFPDKPVPLAVKLLSLYDSWTYQGHKLEDMVLPFQMRMRMEELDPKDWGDYEEEGSHAYWWIQRLLRNDPAGEHWLKPLIDEGRLLLRYDETQKAKYAKTYAFETILAGDIVDPNGELLALKAIVVNLGHSNSKVFDSVWRKECKWCRGKGYLVHKVENKSVGCKECNSTGYLEPYDIMIAFVCRKDKLWNVSLYSTKPEIDCGEIAKTFGGGGHKGAAGFQCKELPFEY